MRQWHNRPDSDQPEEVSANLQELYDLWNQKQPQRCGVAHGHEQERHHKLFFALGVSLKDNAKSGN